MSPNQPASGRPSNPQRRKPAKPTKPTKQDATVETDDIEETGQRFMLFNVMPSWMVSFITHIAIILALAIMVLPDRRPVEVALQTSEQTVSDLDSIEMDMSDLEFDTSEAFETEISQDSAPEMSESLEEIALADTPLEFGDFMAEDSLMDSDTMGELSMSDLTQETGSRAGQGKDQLLKKYGGSAASEAAVALALKWIVAHQLPDGGWNLDHRIGPGNFRTSPNPGRLVEARNGATALAILPLLGAGHTHQTGEYKEQVAAGLKFLMERAKRGRKGISYLEPGGSMYSHGLVSIVFCEAYAMTKDPELAKFAQGTVWYIEEAQDPVGGGWRYTPREPGDTSAVGWQLMALKSAKISGLDISPLTYKRAEKFLDSVSDINGAHYGYMNPPSGPRADGRTAVGLLCRMYMGWDKSFPGLLEGVATMSERGPSMGGESTNMYYNYYATQVMKHIDGEDWQKWNAKMRDYLIREQSKSGPTAGSWFLGSDHDADAGGRLYSTSLACMTLEVYYRYLPLYGDNAANEEFPLD